MPRYDQQCPACDWKDEVFLKFDERMTCPQCGGTTEHYWTSQPSSVIGDAFSEPMGFTPYDTQLMKTGRAAEATIVHSHSERRAVMRSRGLREAIDHVGDDAGTDKSRHTIRWASGPPPGVDPRPSCMLSAEEQAARRAEWLATEPVGAIRVDVTDVAVPALEEPSGPFEPHLRRVFAELSGQ